MGAALLVEVLLVAVLLVAILSGCADPAGMTEKAVVPLSLMFLSTRLSPACLCAMAGVMITTDSPTARSRRLTRRMRAAILCAAKGIYLIDDTIASFNPADHSLIPWLSS
jgi:hypothetical protein